MNSNIYVTYFVKIFDETDHKLYNLLDKGSHSKINIILHMYGNLTSGFDINALVHMLQLMLHFWHSKNLLELAIDCSACQDSC